MLLYVLLPRIVHNLLLETSSCWMMLSGTERAKGAWGDKCGGSDSIRIIAFDYVGCAHDKWFHWYPIEWMRPMKQGGKGNNNEHAPPLFVFVICKVRLFLILMYYCCARSIHRSSRTYVSSGEDFRRISRKKVRLLPENEVVRFH